MTIERDFLSGQTEESPYRNLRLAAGELFENSNHSALYLRTVGIITDQTVEAIRQKIEALAVPKK